MKNLLNKLPIPICGLILGLVSLGNLYKGILPPIIGNIMGIIGIVLMILVIMKIVVHTKESHQALKDPIIGSVSPTFSMALLVICTYLLPLPHMALFAKGLWILACVIQVSLVLFFNWHHVVKNTISITDVYPSWFIIFVGFGVITVTAKDFFPSVGQWFFWLSLGLYLFFLPIIIKRIQHDEKLAEGALPLTTILSAPVSLCLTGYLKDFDQPFLPLAVGLFILSQVLYLWVISQMKDWLKLPFYPSYAAFTFPLVISATACYTFYQYLGHLGMHSTLLLPLAIVEITIATVVVGYVLISYLKFLFADTSLATSKKTVEN